MFKSFLRYLKSYLNKTMGTASDELFWKFRSIFQSNWAESYVNEASLNHPHRQMLLEVISRHSPFDSLLEIGCASGPNLYLISRKYPQARLEGIDISPKAIQAGKSFLAQKGVQNVQFSLGKAYDLRQFPSQSVDVVLSDACLIYLDPVRIKIAVAEMVRVARKTIVLNEFYTDQDRSIHEGNWIHNWKELFAAYVPLEKIILTRLPQDLFGTDNWAKYGYLIEISLQ